MAGPRESYSRARARRLMSGRGILPLVIPPAILPRVTRRLAMVKEAAIENAVNRWSIGRTNFASGSSTRLTAKTENGWSTGFAKSITSVESAGTTETWCQSHRAIGPAYAGLRR